MNTRQILIGTLGSLAMLAGCTGNSLNTVPVSGKVTYQGQPVEGATVSFVGEGELKTAVAITKADGSYQLMTLDSKGAMPGSYPVVVTKTELPPAAALSMDDAAKMAGKAPPQLKRLLPTKYGDQRTTPLKLEVKAGQTNVHDLPLAD